MDTENPEPAPPEGLCAGLVLTADAEVIPGPAPQVPAAPADDTDEEAGR